MWVLKLVLYMFEYPQMEQVYIPVELIIEELIKSSRLANTSSPKAMESSRLVFFHVHSQGTSAWSLILTKITGYFSLGLIDMSWLYVGLDIGSVKIRVSANSTHIHPILQVTVGVDKLIQSPSYNNWDSDIKQHTQSKDETHRGKLSTDGDKPLWTPTIYRIEVRDGLSPSV